MFESPETFGKVTVSTFCYKCRGGNPFRAIEAAAGSGLPRRKCPNCDGTGECKTTYNVHASEGETSCRHCGLSYEHVIHELRQKRLI